MWLTVVVPMLVGVVRPLQSQRPIQARCPHARGGGPYGPSRQGYPVHVVPMLVGVVRWHQPITDGQPQLSPCSWGWSGTRRPQPWQHRRCPHARGGGPELPHFVEAIGALSPCSWGWSEQAGLYGVASKSCPHARGGGPLLALGQRLILSALSPCSWGWSVL